jgi:hypothetical protein
MSAKLPLSLPSITAVAVKSGAGLPTDALIMLNMYVLKNVSRNSRWRFEIKWMSNTRSEWPFKAYLYLLPGRAFDPNYQDQNVLSSISVCGISRGFC